MMHHCLLWKVSCRCWLMIDEWLSESLISDIHRLSLCNRNLTILLSDRKLRQKLGPRMALFYLLILTILYKLLSHTEILARFYVNEYLYFTFRKILWIVSHVPFQYCTICDTIIRCEKRFYIAFLFKTGVAWHPPRRNTCFY